MTIRPSPEEARGIAAAQGCLAVPICAEMYADMVTPVDALRRLKGASRHCFILESAEDSKSRGRYTFLGFDPSMEISCLDGEMRVRPASGEARSFRTGDPSRHIREILAQRKSARVEGMPPFTGGLVGYFAYDYAKYYEPALRLGASGPGDDERFNDVDLMLFDKVIAFDNLMQKIFLIANIFAEGIEAEHARGSALIAEMKAIIESGPRAEIEPARAASEFRALFGKDEFCAMAEKAKERIREGDIFQAVLSNRFDADFEGSVFDAYRVLRASNPSPYMFYFGGSDLEIAGASPETLVKLRDGRLSTFPLAGTRPRGATDEEDLALERELLADEKELAEHNMLVDLGRNDLGKISEFGTVEVEKYMSVLRFSHVMHIGSAVASKIRGGLDGLDAIGAVLPAGTLSGAPKIRAMQIIGELEKNRRGIYGGAIGYLDFAGNMDTCIAIRIAYKRNGRVYVRSGAGIVADSDPESEYRECAGKSAAALDALRLAEGGLG